MKYKLTIKNIFFKILYLKRDVKTSACYLLSLCFGGLGPRARQIQLPRHYTSLSIGRSVGYDCGFGNGNIWRDDEEGEQLRMIKLSRCVARRQSSKPRELSRVQKSVRIRLQAETNLQKKIQF